jgi:hypothetical protein
MGGVSASCGLGSTCCAESGRKLAANRRIGAKNMVRIRTLLSFWLRISSLTCAEYPLLAAC